MASDSRLSGNGQQFDHGQKVFQLPRSDSLFGFAGDTDYAYPLLMQMLLSIRGFPESQERRQTLGRVQGHMLRVFKQCYESLHGFGPGRTKPYQPPDNFFLFGGFDWETAQFLVWRLVFNEQRNTFEYERALSPAGLQFIFVGDDRTAVRRATRRTAELMRANGHTRTSLDMEPFQALCELITEKQHPSIGGAPQLAKAYRHLNTQAFQVIWPGPGGEPVPHIAGRPVLQPEKLSFPEFDPAKGFYGKPWVAGGLGS
jgi:hypothetical protein